MGVQSPSTLPTVPTDISRVGVQTVATRFPADMASNMPHMRNELRPRC